MTLYFGVWVNEKVEGLGLGEPGEEGEYRYDARGRERPIRSRMRDQTGGESDVHI